MPKKCMLFMIGSGLSPSSLLPQLHSALEEQKIKVDTSNIKTSLIPLGRQARA
jgi:hypothetical protein